MSKMEWKTLSKETCFKTDWFSVSKNRVRLENGVDIDDYYVIDNQDAVMILAMDIQNEVVLKQEYRLPVGEVLLELPAGAIENTDRSILDAAKRELLEETGYSSEDWEYLGQTYDCPERCTAKLHLFLVRDAERRAEQTLDRNEIINVTAVSFEEALNMCMDGRIVVNSCIHTILKVARKLGL